MEWSEVVMKHPSNSGIGVNKGTWDKQVKFILYKGHINTICSVPLRLHRTCGVVGSWHYKQVKFILYKGHINTICSVPLRLHRTCGVAGTCHFSGYCSRDGIGTGVRSTKQDNQLIETARNGVTDVTDILIGHFMSVSGYY
ncbi:hypothetical protein J6590_085266 [Homalodisca vitripennis]|nr:hypothetical protein J6590_085266 [Homalodisca vitripennis]